MEKRCNEDCIGEGTKPILPTVRYERCMANCKLQPRRTNIPGHLHVYDAYTEMERRCNQQCTTAGRKLILPNTMYESCMADCRLTVTHAFYTENHIIRIELRQRNQYAWSYCTQLFCL
ncbi:hypothetical protein D918_04545 [Trichuris suis]|nr:hypothetical protein D918_04545 [Trichuris suis]